MQIMVPAWLECQKALRFKASRFDPKMSIYCSGWYMQRMHRIWSGRNRTDAQIWPLELASYNAGPGSVIRAQEQCADALEWRFILPCLPAITGSHAIETIRYADVIPHWRKLIEEESQ